MTRRSLTVPLPSAPGLRAAQFTATVALLIAVVVIGVLRLSEHSGDDTAAHTLHLQRDAVSTAIRYTTAFATYDYQHLDRDFAITQSHAINPFLDQYRKETAQIRAQLVKAKSRSTGTVRSAGIVSLHANTAMVDLFLDQTISNAGSSQPRTDPQRVEMTLVRRDGRWLISQVTLP